MINNQFSGNNMPFYGDNLNYNRNFKKDMQYDNLKQKSSGLGFFVFAYSLTMTACAVIIAEVFKNLGSAGFILSNNYALLNYFIDIFFSCNGGGLIILIDIGNMRGIVLSCHSRPTFL